MVSSFSIFQRLKTNLAWPLLVSWVIYLTFVWMYADGAHTHSRVMRELFLWPACMGLVATYVWGLLLLQKETATRQQWWWVIGGSVVCGLACWAIQPFHSTDVFGYINRGWQQVAYGSNPYVTTIAQLPGWQQDPMLTNHWVNNPCPYGPLFAHWAAWVVGVFPNDLPATLGVIKGLNLLWLWGVTAAVAIGAAWWQGYSPTSDTGQAIVLRRVYLLGMNPLLLLQHVANGHNDVWMGGLLALAIVASIAPYLKQETSRWELWRWPVSTILWVASVLIKYATGLAGLLVIWGWCVQRQWKQVLALGSLALVTVLVLGFPYWLELDQFQLARMGANATLPHSSLHGLLVFSGNAVFKLLGVREFALPVWIKLTRWLLLLGLLGTLVFWGKRLFQHRQMLTNKTVWEAGLWCLAVFVGLVSSKFYPWYVGMVLPAVALLPGRHRLFQLVMAVGLAQVFGVTVLGQARIADVLLMTVLPLLLVVWWRYGNSGSSHSIGLAGYRLSENA